MKKHTLTCTLFVLFVPSATSFASCGNNPASAAQPAATPALAPAELVKAAETINCFFNIDDLNRVTSVQKLIQALSLFDASFGDVAALLQLPAPTLTKKIRSVSLKLPAWLQERLKRLSDDDMTIIINEIKAIDILDHFVDPSTDITTIARWSELVDTTWNLVERSPRYQNLGEKLLGLRNSWKMGICWGLSGLLDAVPCWIKTKGQATGISELLNRIKF